MMPTLYANVGRVIIESGLVAQHALLPRDFLWSWWARHCIGAYESVETRLLTREQVYREIAGIDQGIQIYGTSDLFRRHVAPVVERINRSVIEAAERGDPVHHARLQLRHDDDELLVVAGWLGDKTCRYDYGVLERELGAVDWEQCSSWARDGRAFAEARAAKRAAARRARRVS